MNSEPQQPDSAETHPEGVDFSGLGFQQLQGAFKTVNILASTTFTRLDNGFVNVMDDGIYIRDMDGTFRLSVVSHSLTQVHLFLATHTESVLTKGSTDKEEMMRALESLLKELGNRIIE